MDNFSNIFGFDRNDNIVDIDPTKKYGLAIFSKIPDGNPGENICSWQYMKGKWFKLWNFYCGLNWCCDVVNYEFIYAIGFFEINENYEPISIILKAKVIGKNKIMGDLSWVNNVDNITPIEFEI